MNMSNSFAGNSLEPPIPPSLWGKGQCASVSWQVGERWHFIIGDCVEKPEHLQIARDNQRPPIDYGLNLVISGHGYYRDWYGHRHRLGPGVAYQCLPQREHRVEIDPDCHWCEVFITIKAWTVQHLLDLGLIDDCPVYYVRHPELIISAFRDVLLMLAQTNSKQVPAILVQIQNLLMAIQEDIQGEDDPDPHRHVIADACTILDCQLDQELSMESVALEVGMAYETFRKAFKLYRGMAPGAYRVRKRIERASVLLCSTQLPINLIAEQLGYSDGFSFSAQFKKIIGMSPSAYRLVKS